MVYMPVLSSVIDDEFMGQIMCHLDSYVYMHLYINAASPFCYLII